MPAWRIDDLQRTCGSLAPAEEGIKHRFDRRLVRILAFPSPHQHDRCVHAPWSVPIASVPIDIKDTQRWDPLRPFSLSFQHILQQAETNSDRCRFDDPPCFELDDVPHSAHYLCRCCAGCAHRINPAWVLIMARLPCLTKHAGKAFPPLGGHSPSSQGRVGCDGIEENDVVHLFFVLLELLRRGKGNRASRAQSADNIGTSRLPLPHLLHTILSHIGNGRVSNRNPRQAAWQNSIDCVARRHSPGKIEVGKDFSETIEDEKQALGSAGPDLDQRRRVA